MPHCPIHTQSLVTLPHSQFAHTIPLTLKEFGYTPTHTSPLTLKEFGYTSPHTLKEIVATV